MPTESDQDSVVITHDLVDVFFEAWVYADDGSYAKANYKHERAILFETQVVHSFTGFCYLKIRSCKRSEQKEMCRPIPILFPNYKKHFWG